MSMEPEKDTFSSSLYPWSDGLAPFAVFTKVTQREPVDFRAQVLPCLIGFAVVALMFVGEHWLGPRLHNPPFMLALGLSIGAGLANYLWGKDLRGAVAQWSSKKHRWLLLLLALGFLVGGIYSIFEAIRAMQHWMRMTHVSGSNGVFWDACFGMYILVSGVYYALIWWGSRKHKAVAEIVPCPPQ
jgi:hypothetical protein